MEIDLSKPKEIILKEWANHIRSQSPELTEEKALELAKKTMPYLSCLANNGEKVPPMRCMFCPYGHMLDCHHPFTCDEAECSHYSEDIEDDEDYFDQDNDDYEVE